MATALRWHSKRLGRKPNTRMHPKVTRRSGGRLWHLEDEKLPVTSARALKQHLTHTEDKKAKIVKVGRTYQVWWAR